MPTIRQSRSTATHCVDSSIPCGSASSSSTTGFAKATGVHSVFWTAKRLHTVRSKDIFDYVSSTVGSCCGQPVVRKLIQHCLRSGLGFRADARETYICLPKYKSPTQRAPCTASMLRIDSLRCSPAREQPETRRATRDSDIRLFDPFLAAQRSAKGVNTGQYRQGCGLCIGSRVERREAQHRRVFDAQHRYGQHV